MGTNGIGWLMMWSPWRRLAPAGSKRITYTGSPSAFTMVTCCSCSLRIPSKRSSFPHPRYSQGGICSRLLELAAVDCGQGAHLASTPQFLCQCYENDIYLLPLQGCGGDRSGSLHILLSVISQTN